MQRDPFRPLVLAAIAAALLLVTSGSAHAEQLVIFKNGKVMRVKSAAEDGKWLKCDFEGGNFISVPRADVRGIEMATPGGREGELRVNQLAEGTGGGYVPPRPQPGVTADPEPAQQLDQSEQEQLRQSLAEEQAAREQNPTVTGAGRPRLGGRLQMSNPTMQPAGGFQPLNQVRTPFQGRSGRGLTNRNSGLPVQGGTQQGDE